MVARAKLKEISYHILCSSFLHATTLGGPLLQENSVPNGNVLALASVFLALRLVTLTSLPAGRMVFFPGLNEQFSVRSQAHGMDHSGTPRNRPELRSQLVRQRRTLA